MATAKITRPKVLAQNPFAYRLEASEPWRISVGRSKDDAQEVELLHALPAWTLSVVCAQAAGTYQEALLNGDQPWSGAGAGKWGATYAKSRKSLLARIQAALPDGWSATVENVRDQTSRYGTRRTALVLWATDATGETRAHVWGAGKVAA